MKSNEEEDFQFRCTEIDFWVDYDTVQSTASNLVRAIIRAKKLSQIKKERKPKISKKPKKPK